MAINSVWLEFNERFPTNKDCLKELHRQVHAAGIIKCGSCGNTAVEETDSGRAVRCKSCRTKTWLTAGTFFHRVRLPKAWLAAIWFMEHGIILSSSQFHKVAGIAQSSALQIFKKLTMVMQSQMGENAPEVASANFRPVFCKRSRLTPAGEHPSAEQEEIDRTLSYSELASNTPVDTQQDSMAGGSHIQHSPELTNSSSTVASALSQPTRSLLEEASDQKSSGEQLVYQTLSLQPLNVDALCELINMPIGELLATLTLLELSGLAIRLPSLSRS